MSARRRPVVLSTLLGLATAAGLVAFALARTLDTPDPAPPVGLSIGITSAESALLVRMADAEGFFADQNLDVTVVPYDLGRRATAAMFEGTLDLATTSQFAAARFGAERPDLRILASIDEADTTYVVARRDADIASARDLAGRRVGVSLGTSAEFFMAHFLLSNGLSPDSVEAVDIGPAEYKQALFSGTVDAAVTWQPHHAEVMRRLGDAAVVLSDDHKLSYFLLLVTTQRWLAGNGDAAERVLRALAAADALLAEEPERARRFISERLGQDPDSIEWRAGRFRLDLGQGVLTAMEDQAAWMRERGTLPAVPDYLEMMRTDPLTAVRPDAVTLFR